MRTDGNNVDMDLEKVNQAANSLMYNALITQANSKLNMTKSVILGGNNGYGVIRYHENKCKWSYRQKD